MYAVYSAGGQGGRQPPSPMVLEIIGLKSHITSDFIFTLNNCFIEIVSSYHVVYLPFIEVFEYCREQAVDNGVTLPIGVSCGKLFYLCQSVRVKTGGNELQVFFRHNLFSFNENVIL